MSTPESTLESTLESTPETAPVTPPKFREVYGAGEHLFDQTLLIRRKYGVPIVPATGQGHTEPCYRAGQMRGAGIDKTVLRFADTVRGACVATEDWDRPQVVSHYWNHNNKTGDTTKRCNLHPRVEELTIFGPAQLGNYPSSLPFPAWDPDGSKRHRNHPNGPCPEAQLVQQWPKAEATSRTLTHESSM